MIPLQWQWRIKRFSNLHIQGKKANILLFSTARSGSTWVMELIASQSGMKTINEPFNVTRFAGVTGPMPATWDCLLPHHDRERLIKQYLEQLLCNKNGIGSVRPLGRFHRFVTWRIVIKILRCKDLMNWFEDNFRAKVVYLLRHPIPTSMSRESILRAPLFLKNERFCDRFITPEQCTYANKVLRGPNDLQKKTLDWCFQNIPPLKFSNRRKWLCLHYEDLVINPKGHLPRLATELELDQLERLRRRFQVASSTTYKSDSQTRRFFDGSDRGNDRSHLVTKWKHRISEDDEKRVFEVLDQFEIDTYERGNFMPANRVS